MLRVLFLCVMVLLAGCSEQLAPHTASQAPSPARTSSTDEASSVPRSISSQPFFVGRWASEEANCRGLSWMISEQGLQTPGEVTCEFLRIIPTERGFDVDAICTAESPPQPWTLRFSYAQSARALLIENAPFADIGLIRCGDLEEEAGDSPAANDPRAAADVVRRYYALLNAGRADEALLLWTPSGYEGAREYSKQVGDFETLDARVGEPGRIDGAAGSLYVTIPVQIDARSNGREDEHFSLEVTLRRVNDVPGSTPEQRSWRIMRIESPNEP